MSRVTDARYICQNAANAIISEIGPYQVSNDALQAINQFLDELLIYLLSSSLSLDLSRIKAVVFSLLPSTLGKNAIVEAELEVKTFTETEAIDYESYEKMRTLGSNGSFPLNDTLPLLREKCLEFCTLADREDTNSVMGNNHYSNLDISIAPIVAIYVTTVLEHIAEYVLTAIAMTAEHEDVEYIRIKEVFLALIDDVQVGGVFYRMELREKLERRAFSYGYRPRTSTYASSFHQPSKQHLRNSTAGSQHNGLGDGAGGAGGILDITFDDDLDLGYDDDESNDHPSSISANKNNTRMNRGDHLSMSAYSMKSNFSQPRPTSMMSSSTSNGTISTLDSGFNNHNMYKKSFKVFKKEGAIPPTADNNSTTPGSVYDPDAPTMNFEDLIRSGNTMRVSLTPNRLRSIEVKDQTVDEPQPTIAWERRSTSSMSRTRGSAPPSRSASPAPGPRKRSDSIHRQQPPVPKVLSHHSTSLSSINSGSRPSSPSSSPTIKKKESLLDDALHGNDHRQKSPLGSRPSTPPIPKPTVATTLVEPKIRQQQQTPPQKTNNKPVISTSASLHSRFENPRDAPEPPKSKESLPTTTPVVATSPPTVPQHTASITKSGPEKKKQSSNSVTAAAVAAVAPTPSPMTATTAPEKVENSVTPVVVTPKKEEQKQPQRPQIMRRSSMSSRKSRENLRRQREIEEQALAQAATTKLPKQEASAVSSTETTTSSSSSVISLKSSKESVQDNSILPSPPASENASGTSKDSIKERDEQKTSTAEEVDDSDEDEKKVVHFVTTHHKNNQKEQEEPVVGSPTEMTPQEEEKKQNELERPSTIVAQRASMAGSTRRQSLHESYAVGEKLDTVRQRLSTAGSVEMSVKGWETIMKNGDDVITPAAQRRRTMMASTPSSSQTKQESDEEQEQRQDSSSSEGGTGREEEEEEGKESTVVSKGSQSRDPPLATRQTRPVSSVLDKVMKFEQNSLDDFAQQHHRQHRASAYIPRRERFLYLQREPGVLERRINPAFASKPRPIPVDAEVQTDPLPEPLIKPSSDSNNSGNTPPALVITTEDEMGMTTHKELDMESGSEHGMVDGDEEWFLPDDEWEDTQEQETAVVEWLLGEA